MNPTLTLTYHSTDAGFCRVYYTGVFLDTNAKPTATGYHLAAPKKHLYCWQDDGRRGWKIYSCTADGEPSCGLREDLAIITPPPPADGETIHAELTAHLAERIGRPHHLALDADLVQALAETLPWLACHLQRVADAADHVERGNLSDRLERHQSALQRLAAVVQDAHADRQREKPA